MISLLTKHTVLNLKAELSHLLWEIDRESFIIDEAKKLITEAEEKLKQLKDSEQACREQIKKYDK